MKHNIVLSEILSIKESNTISDIKKQEGIFILVIGGSASGKNYIYEKNFKGIPLIDNDEITKRLSGGDFSKVVKMISKATIEANKTLEKSFIKKKSIGQVSTGAQMKGTQNKIINAKSYGMKVALILIDVDIKKAQKRNKDRAATGHQSLIPDWKVEKTNLAARETFNMLKNEADFSIIIKN